MRQIGRTVVSSLSLLMVIVVTTGAPAQPPRGITRVGILNAGTAQDARVEAFRDGLRELGYIEGQTLVTTCRWADGRAERLPMLAADLVASNVDVIVAMGPSAWAVKQQTSTRPIVFAFSGDPVGTGLVSNLARPGGNITGLSFMSSDLAAKRLDLLKQMRPRTARVAALYNPAERATAPELRDTEAAAGAIGVTLQRLEARHADDLERLFAEAARERADGVIVFTHDFAAVNRGRMIELAGAAGSAHDLRLAGVRRGRGTDVVRPRRSGCGPTGGDLRGPHREGRQAPATFPSSSRLGWSSSSTSKPRRPSA